MKHGLIRNKKSVMALSGFLVLFFHLWVYVFPGSRAEQFLRTMAYIGVDMFFFLSACSLGSRRIEDVRGFYKSRLLYVYLPFAVFSVLKCIMSGWKLTKLCATLSGYALITGGGGAFLWFVPAIMILYLLMPLYQRAYEKCPKLTMVFSFVLWLAAGYMVTSMTRMRVIFIFWNRLPVFFLGFFLAGLPKKYAEGLRRPAVAAAFLTAGLFLLYRFAFCMRLDAPVREMFYVMGIPAVLGAVLLCDHIPENKVLCRIGGSTLELYGLQMLIGYPLAEKLYRMTGSAAVTNLIVLPLMMVLAVLLSVCYEKALRLLKREK